MARYTTPSSGCSARASSSRSRRSARAGGPTARSIERPSRASARCSPGCASCWRRRRETSQFFAAVSFVGYLAPGDVLEQLDGRAGRLESEIAGLDALLRDLVPKIGRLVLVESEYLLAMRQAELGWVRSLIEDIRAGRLTWDPEALLRALGAPEPTGRARSAPARRGGDEGG